MNKEQIISANAFKLANRLYEIDKKIDKDNFMLVDEYNSIVEELWNRIPSIQNEQLKKKEKNKQFEVKVIKFDVNWLEIKNLCRATINMNDSKIDPKEEWKKKLLIAEHSPLRHSLITLELNNIPSYVSTHICRHHQGIEKYVGTNRSDRTGEDRSKKSQTDLVNMRIDLNIQSLINISRKRLCNCADKETQKLWLMVVREIVKYDEAVAWACVPEGIFRGGCSESFEDCNVCNNILKNMKQEDMINPIKRYELYHNKTQNKSENKQLKKILLNDFDKKKER